MNLVEPGCDGCFLKLVEPGCGEWFMKLVEPGCDEGAARVETMRLIHRGVLISPNYRFASSGA